MSEDGINYLDIGSAFFAGDWATAVNPIWSPLYGFTLGAVQRLIMSGPQWEFTVVQLTNFGIFAFALVCFECFWRQLAVDIRPHPDSLRRLPEAAPNLWLVLGYSLFTWASLSLVTIWVVTPDMLVTAFVFLAASLFLRLQRRLSSKRLAVLFGTVNGLGYLAKAAMFPMGALLMGLALARSGASGRLRRMPWLAVPFAIIAAPMIYAVSQQSGYVTFGDVGRFTYMKHVNALEYPHWGDSLSRVTGTALHPPRQLLERPRVYEFAEPIGGTYPLGFDPGYWTRGLSPRLDLDQQLRTTIDNLRFYFGLFLSMQGGFTAVVALLLWLGIRRRELGDWMAAEGALCVWAAAALALYALVYAEGRYVAPFVVVLWGGLLTLPRFNATAAVHRSLTHAGIAVLTALVWINISAFNLEGAAALIGFPLSARSTGASARFSDEGSDTRHMEIADALHRLGLRRGDRVAVIGNGFTSYWARLARVRIVSDMPPQDAFDFWKADTSARSRVLAAFARSGALAVVATTPATLPEGWQKVGATGHMVRFLR